MKKPVHFLRLLVALSLLATSAQPAFAEDSERVRTALKSTAEVRKQRVRELEQKFYDLDVQLEILNQELFQAREFAKNNGRGKVIITTTTAIAVVLISAGIFRSFKEVSKIYRSTTSGSTLAASSGSKLTAAGSFLAGLVAGTLVKVGGDKTVELTDAQVKILKKKITETELAIDSVRTELSMLAD